MSQLGNINSSYGHQFDIAVANTFAYNIEGALGLPENNMIISAPVDENNEDLGYSNILFTDANGEAVRFTYSINPTNIHIDGDNVSVETSYVFATDENGLYVDMNRIVDNNTITYNTGKLRVETSHLTKASTVNYGVGKIDENTLKVGVDGALYVDTQRLDKATNSTLGIVTSDNNTIDIIDGVASVVTKNLTKGTEKEYGVVMSNGKTVVAHDGMLSVNTEKLDVASRDRFGISSPDGKTIRSKGGVYSVATENLNKANDTRLGVVRLDPKCFITKNGVLVALDYKELLTSLKEYTAKYNELEAEATKLETIINSGGLKKKKTIQRLTASTTTTALLKHPKYMEEPINMEYQHVYINLDIVTNAKFHMSVDFKNNEVPVCEITQINYNDEFAVDGTRGLDYTFPSTDGKKKKLVIQLNCRNFNSTRLPYSLTTELKITLADASDHLINRSIYFAVVRYNSAIDENEYIKELTKQIVYTESYVASYWYIDEEPDLHHKLNDPNDVPPTSAESIHLHLVYYDNEGNSYVYEDVFDISELIKLYEPEDSTQNNASPQMVMYSIDVTDTKGEKHTLGWPIYVMRAPYNKVIFAPSVVNKYTICRYNTAYIPVYNRTTNNATIQNVFYEYTINGELQTSYLIQGGNVGSDIIKYIGTYDATNDDNNLFNGYSYSKIACTTYGNTAAILNINKVNRITALPSDNNINGADYMYNVNILDPQVSLTSKNIRMEETVWGAANDECTVDLFDYSYILNGIKYRVNYSSYQYNYKGNIYDLPRITITMTGANKIEYVSNNEHIITFETGIESATITGTLNPINNDNPGISAKTTISKPSSQCADVNNIQFKISGIIEISDREDERAYHPTIQFIRGAYIYGENSQNPYIIIIEDREHNFKWLKLRREDNLNLYFKEIYNRESSDRYNVFFVPIVIENGKISIDQSLLTKPIIYVNEFINKGEDSTLLGAIYKINSTDLENFRNNDSNSIIQPHYNKGYDEFGEDGYVEYEDEKFYLNKGSSAETKLIEILKERQGVVDDYEEIGSDDANPPDINQPDIHN